MLLGQAGLLKDREAPASPFDGDSDLGQGEEYEDPGVSFVDDLTVYREADHPRQLVADTAKVIECLLQATAACGLQLQPAKTVVFVTFQGVGHMKRKQEFNNNGGGKIVVPGIHDPVRVVRSQRMLGAILADDGSMGPEVAVRVAIAAASS